MKITEILCESETINEITRPLHITDAEGILYDAGYHRLGDGYFATVFGKPDSNECLKLFKSADIAYMNFVKMVEKNPNIHFPKFKGKLMRVTSQYFAVRMEKLEPPSYFKGAKLAKIMNWYIRLLQIPTLEPYKITSDEVMNGMDILEQEQPGIKEACQIISENLGNHEVDLSSNNFMYRGQTIVITDPVAF